MGLDERLPQYTRELEAPGAAAGQRRLIVGKAGSFSSGHLSYETFVRFIMSGPR